MTDIVIKVASERDLVTALPFARGKDENDKAM